MDPKRLEYLSHMVDQIYTDDGLLVGLLSSFDGSMTPADYFAQKGFELQQTDWKLLDSLNNPGPHFNLRLAGGAYRISSNALGAWELLLDSFDKTIHVDGLTVESQLLHEDGSVTFSTQSQYHFQIKFECALSIGDAPPTTPAFSGEVWQTGQEAQKVPIAGRKCFPWGNVFGQSSSVDYNSGITTHVSDQAKDASARARELAGLKSLAITIDLLNFQKRKETLDVADILIHITHFILTLICAAAGKYVEGPGGAVVGVIGAQSSRMLTAAIKDHYVAEYRRRLQEEIERKQLDARSIVDKVVSESVEGLDEIFLRDGDLADQLRDQVKTEYLMEARSAIDEEIKSTFRSLRLASGEEFWNTYKEALKDKFDAEVSSVYFKSLVKAQVDQRLCDKFVPTDIEKLKEKAKEREQQKLDDIAKISSADPQKWEKRAAIEKEFQKDKKKIEDDRTKKEDELRELRKRDFDDEISKSGKGIESWSEQRRKKQEELQRRGQKKRADQGWGELNPLV